MIVELVAFAGVAIVSIVGLLTLALKLSGAKGDAADARVDAEHQRGELAAMTSDRDTQKRRGDAEKTRADALDDLIAKHAAAAAGPVDGSFKRLLQEWATAGNTTAGGSPGAVPATSAAGTPGPDDLLKPGD